MKNLFDYAQQIFMAPCQIWDFENIIFGVFIYFTIEKTKMLFMEEFFFRCIWGRYIHRSSVQKHFSKFHSGNFGVSGVSPSGRPSEDDNCKIQAMIDANQRQIFLKNIQKMIIQIITLCPVSLSTLTCELNEVRLKK